MWWSIHEHQAREPGDQLLPMLRALSRSAHIVVTLDHLDDHTACADCASPHVAGGMTQPLAPYAEHRLVWFLIFAMIVGHTQLRSHPKTWVTDLEFMS